ncbi:mobilization protein MbpA [Prolixibacter sp. NT017]|uniref:mobilization protein MbpA n=1 Tax=Prolixibacter sp. NT017 TaxID=2652390 RepID=UPI0012736EC0|nr:mobilization protein MbpA [Prolixibacter sp. NT017]GET25844.1 hypothetical protein NT017_21730 [Prolixibacter sp. NT017]
MKRKKIEFRCSSLEKAIIKKKAENAGLKISEFCRATALGQRVTFRMTDEELSVYKMLVTYSNNFTRIGNLFRDKDTRFAQEIRQTSDEIKKHLRRLQ